MTIFALLLILCQSVLAKVHETQTMQDVFSEIRREDPKNTLLVFDIDNTLIEPVGNFGSDQWYYYLSDLYRMQGVPENQVDAKSMVIWNEAQWLVNIKPVEKETPKLITDQQSRGFQVMALTARTPDIAKCTLRQLRDVGISLLKGRKVKEVHFPKKSLGSHDDAVFKDGVLFVGESNNKGQVLVKLLKHLKLNPKKIVFVDDKSKHVKKVEAAIEAAQIAYSGYRYGAADAKVRNFNQLLKDVVDKDTAQLFLLGKITFQESEKIRRVKNALSSASTLDTSLAGASQESPAASPR